MSRQTFWLVTILAVAGALLVSAGPGLAQNSVTGAGAGIFGSVASFGGVALSGLRFGMGIDIATDGTASGGFQSTLLGGTAAAPRRIAVEGKASAGSAEDGVASFSGTCRIDMGDGTPALVGVPFTVVVVPGADNEETLTLTLGTTNLPVATVSEGSTTVK